MTADEIKALLARRADAMVRLDPAGAASQYSEDCVLESGMYGPGKGRAYVENVFRMFFSAFPDITFEFHEAVMFGNQAIQLGSHSRGHVAPSLSADWMCRRVPGAYI